MYPNFRPCRTVSLFLLIIVFATTSRAGEVTPTVAEHYGASVRRHWPKEPSFDEASMKKAGVRRLDGRYITLYTDVKPSGEIESLPKWFDRLVPELCDYFQLDVKNYDDFRVQGFLIDDFEKFKPSGAVRQVSQLRNGYAQRCRIWLRNQQSDYYRRHLFLHEGVHAFMGYAFGAWGPPWYREGTAELLATHRIDDDGKLHLGYFPMDRRELHHWGRIEIVRNDFLDNRGKLPTEVFELASEDYDANTAYGWSWAFAAFCEHHPRYRRAFRQTAWKLGGDSKSVADRFHELLLKENRLAATDSPDRPIGPNDMEIIAHFEQDWTDFLVYLDYGYDFHRTAIEYPFNGRAVMEGKSETVRVQADRGWHSDGLRLERGKTYRLSASGRFQLADKPEPWYSEPNGVTLRYCRGLPIGLLLATLVPDTDERFLVEEDTPGYGFLKPRIIGLGDIWAVEATGTLFFRINDFASELDDNRGEAEVKVVEKPVSDSN